MVLAILSPFVLGEGGRLAAGSSVNSVDQLKAEKKALILRYIQDEQQFADSKISQHIWQQRRQYLINRYIDSAKRMDFLEHLEHLELAESSEGEGPSDES